MELTGANRPPPPCILSAVNIIIIIISVIVCSWFMLDYCLSRWHRKQPGHVRQRPHCGCWEDEWRCQQSHHGRREHPSSHWCAFQPNLPTRGIEPSGTGMMINKKYTINLDLNTLPKCDFILAQLSRLLVLNSCVINNGVVITPVPNTAFTLLQAVTWMILQQTSCAGSVV